MSKSNPSPRQVLLGLFILFQIACLVLGNFLGFIQSSAKQLPEKPVKLINRVVPHFVDGQGHGWQWASQVENNLTWWWQLTGQDQEWSLFAPTVGKATGFPCLLLLGDEPTLDEPGMQEALFSFDAKNGFHLRHERLAKAQLFLSDNEPADVHDFLRLGKCRLRRYEGMLYVSTQPQVLLNVEPHRVEKQDEAAVRVTDAAKQFLNGYKELALTYMQWRLKEWKRSHPDEQAPTQIILCQRFYRIHDPDETVGWDGPFLVPLIRWRPTEDRPDGFRSLQTFDFTLLRFTR